MINLFNIPNHIIDTSNYSNILHDQLVTEFEQTIADYVGSKYAVSFNSATSAIFLALLDKNITVNIPSIIPPVVLNAIITSENKYNFIDNVNWVGDSYILHDFGNYKIVDSAQKLMYNQFKKECNDNDLMIFSFYPTKPVGSCDGGIIVSDDKDKIDYLRELSFNGMGFSENNWDRKIKFAGYKMYMNSLQADIALRNFNTYEEKLKRLKIIRNKYNKELQYKNTSNHLYRIHVRDRDEFINHMKENGIICGVHYDAMHLNSVYKINDDKLMASELIAKTTVSIPFHEKLTDDEVNFIIKKIKDWTSTV